MTEKRFQRWNWEFDFGEGPIPEEEPFPAIYAIVLYDRRGHPYRVVTRSKLLIDYSDDDPAAFDVFAYDYFCDADGKILQKRALDEQGGVSLIVDFEYDLEKRRVIETAYDPTDGICKSINRPLRRP